MCIQEVKEKFKNYYWINKNIEQLEDELLVIESRVMKVTQTFSDLPKMKGHHDKLADNVSDMIEIQNKINRKLPELYKLRSEIEELLNKLPAREQHLIMARYIHAKKFEEIAVDMGYSWQHIHDIHSKALNLMAK